VQQTQTTQFIALYASDLVDGKVKADYYLINLNDNEKLLENDKALKAYSDANTVDELYEVWSKTYQKEYATKGLFEESQAYHIGKERYSIDDLETVTSRDIQGKYHEFATILRQHNVSGRENAFDKLVNLFLCKVVDETNNPDELKFYWKGIAYDDPFSLQDRLNHLYKVGMKKFLGEDITYIENQQIDDAFSVFKDKPNMTKEIIQGFFKELKFFTNNDFAFVDVHNKELFYQNFEVLLKIVKMLQDIKLTGGEDNQFLGDMFEGFLDQGIKQSEGQFFTPMPIVKFIINSLPIEEVLKNEENPKAIDYACGAGHFLNEVANNFPKELHKNIVGVEKEYRLSKVAKVSAFMYGQDDIEIVYHDALSAMDEVKEADYSVLVANPPYSVKGFLETLSEKERANYELLKSLDEKTYVANNAIECFFIERAKQILKKDAVVGIVLPSSILSKGSQNIASSKGNIYVQTREILLKYFSVVAIAEFGSGTFGKTGTNTVTLFLKRKADNPNMAKHLEYMVKAWFDGNFSTNEIFKDKDLLSFYTAHIKIDLALYKTLLENRYDENLFELEMFSEYVQEFNKLTETKNRKKQRYYKALSSEEKAQREEKELLNYVRLIEEDKLYYFCLAYLNPKEVLIVKAPSDGAKNKKFLGYEWSGRKGDEGIKYITSCKAVKLEEGAEALENILNLSNIQTPLYNPKDKKDENKINALIAKNFGDEVVKIPQALEAFVSNARLVDMLDFSRKEFSKAIELSPKRKIEIETKWDLVKIDTVASKIFAGGDKPKNISDIKTDKLNIPIYANAIKEKGLYGFTDIAKVNEECVTISARGTIGYCVARYEPFYPIVRLIIAIPNLKKIITKYMEIIFNEMKFIGNGTGVSQLTVPEILSYKIPLPPLKIQKEIIKKCELVDDEVAKANEEIKKSTTQINKLIVFTQGEEVKLGEIIEMKAGKFVPASKIKSDYEDGLYPCYGGNNLRGYVSTFTHEGVYPLIGRQGALCGNITLASGKFHATEHAVAVTPKIDMEIYWLYHQLIVMNLNQHATGTAQPGLSVKNLESVTLLLPDVDVQKEIVKKIEKLEEKIAKAQMIVDGASERKKAVLREYL